MVTKPTREGSYCWTRIGLRFTAYACTSFLRTRRIEIEVRKHAFAMHFGLYFLESNHVDNPRFQVANRRSSGVDCRSLVWAACARGNGRRGPEALGRFMGDLSATRRARERVESRGSARRDT